MKKDLFEIGVENFSSEYFAIFSKRELKRYMSEKCSELAFQLLLLDISKQMKGNLLKNKNFEVQTYLRSDSNILTWDAKRIFIKKPESRCSNQVFKKICQ